MAFDYDEIKSREDEGKQWASYSDLFMVLSVVFLLLYVTASLRNGTSSIQQHVEYQKLAKRTQDLEQQIKVYNTLKDGYMQNEAKESEKEVYNKLMAKLSLLREEAKDEKEALRRKALENEEKEFALNQYQQIVRNIINTNYISKARIKTKNRIIKTKDEKLEQKEEEITELSQDIKQKEQVIEKNEKSIAKINNELEQKIKNLKRQRQQAKMTRAQYQQRLKKLKDRSRQKVEKLEEKTSQVASQLAEVKQELSTAEQELNQTQQQLQSTSVKNQKLIKELKSQHSEYARQIREAREEFREQKERERDAFKRELETQQMSALAKAQKLAEFNRQANLKAEELKQKVDALKQNIENTEQKLAVAKGDVQAKEKDLEKTKEQLAKTKAEAEAKIAETKQQAAARLAQADAKINETKEEAAARLAKARADAQKQLEQTTQQAAKEQGRLMASLDEAKGEQAKLAKDLAKAKALANARKNLAKKIQKNFKKAGVKASVDGETGDVVLSFGDDYFETGDSKLKASMKSTLERFIPIYAQSLFQDPETSKKIKNIEIVGFASSTYGGKYVNPNSLKPEDQKAIKYNLKLSQERANSVFDYIFDRRKLSYQYQKDLLPKVKVSGRGFLPDGLEDRQVPEGISQKEFCKQFDCKKAQRVIVRFSLDN